MFRNIYKCKKVLITGHTGFKGSWLAIWLRDLGADVIGYSLEPPSEPSNFDACLLKDRVSSVYGDIRDMNHLLETFNKHKPEFVFHLAAQSLVRKSYQEPKLTIDTNVGGAVNVMEAVKAVPSVRVFVNVTSDKCYENREWLWGYRENDPMGGYDPYSASKGCAELVFSAYHRSFFSNKNKMGSASVRAGNVIGGGDWGEDRLIPDCVRALSSSKDIAIRNPKAVRPWQHVLEPLSGYLWLGALLWESPEKYGGAWNFGPSDRDQVSVEKVVEQLVALWGKGKWVDVSGTEKSLHEAHMLKLCCDKAIAQLRWHSTLDFDECLSFTIDWYKRFYEKRPSEDMYNFCAEQIHLYEKKAKERKVIWSD